MVEGPSGGRRDDGFFYLLLLGRPVRRHGRCEYAVGVARSPPLLGPWEKYSGNPIVRGGNGWRCPGHTSITRGRAT